MWIFLVGRGPARCRPRPRKKKTLVRDSLSYTRVFFLRLHNVMYIEEADLKRLIADRDPSLWVAILHIARGYCSRHYTHHHERDDLASEAVLHTHRYAYDYDPSKGTSAHSWLTMCVATAVRHHLDRNRKHIHQDLPDNL